MKIISLTEIQFRNYSRIHSKRNYLQSIEFANMQKNNGYEILYVGMLDNKNNLTAATLILSKKIFGKYIFGYAPGGFLIDYTDYNLFSTFTKLLKEYLYELNYVYISLHPLCPSSITDKNNTLLYFNNEIFNTFNTLGYKKSKRETLDTCLYLETDNNINNTYNKISRFIKRNIKENKIMGIKVFKGNHKDLDKFYNLINKKTNLKKDYYENYLNYFNNENNKFEIYFATLDTNIYLKNCHNLLNKEKRKNEKLSAKILNINIKNKSRYVNKKINSDKLLEKYNNEIKKAINLNNTFKEKIIVSTVAIIKTNNEISFIIDGYEEKTRAIRASYSIKWEIIKLYNKLGYNKFNLGYVPNNYHKYNGVFLSKLGFDAKIYTYPGQYNLIINNTIYTFINFVDRQKYN